MPGTCTHRHGLTLIELLVAVVVTALLLVGLGAAIRQLHSGLAYMPWNGPAGRYAQAAELMRQDVRGLVRLEPLPTSGVETASSEVSGVTPAGAAGVGRGQAVAAFRTTWRVDALDESRWLGSAQVGYWFEERVEGGGMLWRSESPPAGQDEGWRWTPLADGLESVVVEVWRDGRWSSWPSDAETASSTPPALRVTAVQRGEPGQRAVTWPTAVLATMHALEPLSPHAATRPSN